MKKMGRWPDIAHHFASQSNLVRAGHVLLMQRAPIIWCPKRQGGVEGASFGSEFVASETFAQTNCGFRHEVVAAVAT